MPEESVFPTSQGCVRSLSEGTPDAGNDNTGPLFLRPASSLPTFEQAYKTKAAPLFLTFPCLPRPGKCGPPTHTALLPQLTPGSGAPLSPVQAAPAHEAMEQLVKSNFKSSANGAHHSCVCI